MYWTALKRSAAQHAAKVIKSTKHLSTAVCASGAWLVQIRGNPGAAQARGDIATSTSVRQPSVTM